MASWRGRVVIVAAVAVSLGTSKAGWHIEVELPAMPIDSRALELTVEASTRPWVTCNVDGVQVELQPRLAGTTYTYLCPPKGQLMGPIVISGRDGVGGNSLFCNNGPPKPPPDQFLRVKQLVPVDTWLIEVRGEIPFTRTTYDPDYGETSFDVIHPSGQVTATIEAPGLVEASVSPTQDGTQFNAFAKYRDVSKPQAMIIVHAKVYGTGAKPDDSTITIEGRGGR